jgi:hypothetical protein
VRRADLHVVLVFKSDSLNILETSVPVQACTGIALLLSYSCNVSFVMHLPEDDHKSGRNM